jgi:hypothetical protein
MERFPALSSALLQQVWAYCLAGHRHVLACRSMRKSSLGQYGPHRRPGKAHVAFGMVGGRGAICRFLGPVVDYRE